MRQDNLNPEIEEKLLNLQRCHEKQMKGVHRPTSVALANNHHEYTSPVKYSSSARKHPANRPLEADDDWIMDTPKRRPPRASSFSEKKNAQNAAVVENDVNRIIRSVAEESGVPTVAKTPLVEPQSPAKKPVTAPVATVATPIKSPIKSPVKSPVVIETKPVSSSVNEISPSKRAAQTKKDNEKKKQMQVSCC